MTKPNDAADNCGLSHCYPNFALGMQFYFVHNERRHTRDSIVTITKIGRKWITLSGTYRIDRTSPNWRIVDGGCYSSPGRLWDSEDHYAENLQVQQIIDAIDRHFRFSSSSENVSLLNAKQAARLLGLEVG